MEDVMERPEDVMERPEDIEEVQVEQVLIQSIA